MLLRNFSNHLKYRKRHNPENYIATEDLLSAQDSYSASRTSKKTRMPTLLVKLQDGASFILCFR
jgi:hypothetical protein